MRSAVAALMALSVAAVASAQDSTWRQPDGRFMLAPGSVGAHTLPTMEGDLADFQLGPQAPVRICNVRQSIVPGAGATPQAQLNQRMAAIATMNGAQAPGLTISDKRSFERDGVTILAYRMAAPEDVMHEWMFAIAAPTGALLVKIHCVGALPVTPADEAKFDAFLDTLHFPTTSQTP